MALYIPIGGDHMPMAVEDRIRKLNASLGKLDENMFQIESIQENFFNEYVVSLKINRMLKASYSILRKIAEITGAKDILIEKTEGDNLLEIKLLIPKK